jgi:hypothetical protein
MPTTPVYALPYPAQTDPADVPTDMQELAERIEAVFAPVVTALPGSPYAGQEVTWRPAGLNVGWRMRYIDATLKWVFVGGGWAVAEQPADSAGVVTTSYLAIPPNCEIAVPAAGTWLIQHSAAIWNTTVGAFVMQSPKYGVAAAADVDGLMATMGSATMVTSVATAPMPRAIAAGQTVTLHGRVGSGAGGFRYRRLAIQPAFGIG